MASGVSGVPPLVMIEVGAEEGCTVRLDGASVQVLRMRRAGKVLEVRVRLRCMIRWRDGSEGEAAHYACQWADVTGAWWASDGLVCSGAALSIPAPTGRVTARTGAFFPVIMIYEKVGEEGITVG